MPRSGYNPLKGKKIEGSFSFAPVSVCTIVYIPSMDGHWEESFEVLKLFFESLFSATSQSFDLIVFDNGSCKEVQDYLIDLRRQKQIQYLVLSQYNYQKLGALNDMLSIAPGDYVAYADCDVFFLPGWLKKSLDVLKTYPEAGYVSALPLVDKDQTRTFEYQVVVQDPTINIETGNLISDEFIHAHRISYGLSPATYQRWLKDRRDVRITRNGVMAYLARTDFQFLLTRQAIEKLLPLPLDYSGGTGPVIESRIDNTGIWRLCTTEYMVHHMGNKVPDLETELPWLKGSFPDLAKKSSEKGKILTPQPARKRNLIASLSRKKLVRRFLKYLYLRTYQLLFEVD